MSRRLLVVAPRLWPLVDDNALRVLHWASKLRETGTQVTVLTPRWHETWPAEAECREVRIVRLLPAPKTSWSQSHYLRALAKWIVIHRSEFDAIYVDEPLHLLHQVVHPKVAQGMPVLARFSASQIALESPFVEEAFRIAGDGCRKVKTVIVPDAPSHRRLKSLGISDDKIVRIPDSSWSITRRDDSGRRLAQTSLSKVSGDLYVPSGCKVILFLGDIHRRWGVNVLCQSVGELLDENAQVRVWLMGQGESIKSLYGYLRDRSWHRDIQIHGCFDSVEDLLQVADLCVFPGEGCGLQYYLPMAIASGVPWLAADGQDVRAMVGNNSDDLLISSGAQSAWTEALQKWLRHQDSLSNPVAQAQQHFFEQRNTAEILQAWDRVMFS